MAKSIVGAFGKAVSNAALKTRFGGVPVNVAIPPILAPYGIDKIKPENKVFKHILIYFILLSFSSYLFVIAGTVCVPNGCMDDMIIMGWVTQRGHQIGNNWNTFLLN